MTYGIGLSPFLPRSVTFKIKSNPDMLKIYWYVYQFQPVDDFRPDVLDMKPQRISSYLSWMHSYKILFRKRSESDMRFRKPWIYRVNPEYVETFQSKFGAPFNFGDEEKKSIKRERKRQTNALRLNRSALNIGWEFTGCAFGEWLEIRPYKKYSPSQECRYIRKSEWENINRYPSFVPSYYIEGALSRGMVKDDS